MSSEKQRIYDAIMATGLARQVNNRELNMRCFICGDSSKNMSKKRLYLKIDLDNPTEPIYYNCFNCNEFGILKPNMLELIGIDNAENKSDLRRLNKMSYDKDGSSIRLKRNKQGVIDVVIPPPYKNEKTARKIKYLYDRIGYRIPLEDFGKLKIIFNLHDFLKANNIPPNNNHTWLLDRDYIGFLSNNNEYVILRDITNSNKFRYVKYNVFNSKDNSQAFYAIKTKLDILSTEPVEIIISEGTFDIHSILYNLYDGDDTNKIFISSCNGTFLFPLMYYVNKGFVGSNIHVSAYMDNDTTLNFKKLKEQLKPYIASFAVYYNAYEGKKDFGVPKEFIIKDKYIIR